MKRVDYNKILAICGIILVLVGTVLLLCCTITLQEEILENAVLKVSITNIIVGAILVYLYNQNTNVIETHYNINIKKNISDCGEIKIAHISDVHNTNSSRIKNKIIKALLNNKPDMIVITGDLIDGKRTDIEGAKLFVEKLAKIAKTYYVFGNHESNIKDISNMENIMKKMDVSVLRNDSIPLKESVNLIGIDDPAFCVVNQDEYEMKDKLNNKLGRLVENEQQLNILIIHRPEYIDVYSKNKIDIAFTGHAHGGQIRLPFVGGIIAPGQGWFPKYTKGVHKINDTYMIVNRGIGNSRFPFRINNRPELVIARLNVINAKQ